jgi:hypothetical protein
MKLTDRFRQLDWNRLGPASNSTKDQFTLRKEWSLEVRQSNRAVSPLLWTPIRVKTVSVFILLSAVAVLAAQGVTSGSEDLLLRPVDEVSDSLCASCGITNLPPGALHATV